MMKKRVVFTSILMFVFCYPVQAQWLKWLGKTVASKPTTIAVEKAISQTTLKQAAFVSPAQFGTKPLLSAINLGEAVTTFSQVPGNRLRFLDPSSNQIKTAVKIPYPVFLQDQQMILKAPALVIESQLPSAQKDISPTLIHDAYPAAQVPEELFSSIERARISWEATHTFTIPGSRAYFESWRGGSYFEKVSDLADALKRFAPPTIYQEKVSGMMVEAYSLPAKVFCAERGLQQAILNPQEWVLAVYPLGGARLLQKEVFFRHFKMVSLPSKGL